MPRTLNILLVEDSIDDVELVRIALRRLEIECRLQVAPSGEDALARMRRAAASGGGVPDLVLLDLNLPGKTGLEVLSEVMKDDSLRLVPLVIFSTSDLEQDVRTAYNLGAHSYLTKPDRFDLLVERLRGLLSYWFGTVRLPQKD